MTQSRPIKMSVQVALKSSTELGIIWGWVSVADLLDLQGDVIPQSVLESAFYQFMEDYYAGSTIIDENHDGEQSEAVLVESCLEWRAGALRWWVGVKLLSDNLREAAREGQISGFSITGVAQVED